MNELITEKIIGCAYTVANTLGSGFLEKVYENAMAHELRKAGLAVQQQAAISVNNGCHPSGMQHIEPGGFMAISRWLSIATPPVGVGITTTGCLRHHREL